MISLKYTTEIGQNVVFNVDDWDAVQKVADDLVRAPIDIDYLQYKEGITEGVFNLNTFERC